MTPSDEERRLKDLRDKIIGLGETSHRKSYYPQLREQISDLHLALAALKESELRYRTLIENVNIGIFRSDVATGRLLQVNPALCTMLGYASEEELMSTHVSSLYEDPGERERLLDLVRKESRVRDRKVKVRRKDGTLITSSMTLSAVNDGSGRLRMVDGVIEDITEKELKAEALHQANRKLNLLSSITRHDITNQLMVLEGYLTLLGERIEGPGELALLRKVEASAMAIERHIAFTKDYQDIGIHAPQWTSLKDSLVRSLVTIDKTLLSVHIRVGGYEVFTDPMVDKVFYNLASNVIKHSKATTLDITARKEGDHLLIAFQDNGVGVKDRSKLFTRGGPASGYGLFLSKEVLGITGIGIRETGTPGQGARFEIVVPPGLYRPYEHRPKAAP